MLSQEFTCWIEIEGEKAKEYCIERIEDDDGGPTITCWIASSTNKHFTVHWTDSKALSDIVGSVTVDGKSTSDTSISYKGKPNVEMTAEGFRVSEDAIRPFLFNRIKFKDTSSNEDLDDDDLAEKIGQILVEINRCSIEELESDEEPVFADLEDLPNQTIHERQGKQKNMMFHRVGAGPSTQISCKGGYLYYLDEVKAVKFIFNFRTMDELIAMEIAPNPRYKNKRRAVDEVTIVSDDEVVAKTQPRPLQRNMRRGMRYDMEHSVKRVKKRVRDSESEDSEYIPRPSSSHHSSPLQTRLRAFKLRRSTRHIKKMIRKEQDNIRPAPSSSDSDSDSSRHSSESSQDSDDPVQTIASQSSTAGCVTQKIIKREDQDDMMSLASSPSHHNSSQDVLLHSDVPAYSTQISMASQSGTRHVKTEKEEPIPSSSSCHNSSRAEDDQQLPEPQASPGLELSQDKVDAHNTKCSICLSERIKGIRYKCLVCPDFDTCSSCFEVVGAEHPHHTFTKIRIVDYVAPKEVKGPKHSANCTNCKRPIYGARFKCTHAGCQNYNLCEACEALQEPVHPLEHSLLKIRTAS